MNNNLLQIYPNFGTASDVGVTYDNNLLREGTIIRPYDAASDNVSYKPITLDDPLERVESFAPLPMATDSCKIAEEHWKCCAQCRKREFVSCAFEMIIYILTGVFIIVVLKGRR